MPDPDAPLLTAQNVHFAYQRKGRTILHDVSLALLPGKLTVLLGPNGSGKSTLIRCLAGMQRPTEGHVRSHSDDVSRLPAHILAQRIAYAPQTLPAPFAFTVRELIGLSQNAAPVPSDLDALLATFDLTGMADRSLLTLSGGERQRAASARAFAQNTPCLLLDEPTAHLDLRHQSGLMLAAQNRARHDHAAVCIVLHDLNLAAAFADHIILLHEGRIVAEGTSADVLTASILSRVYQTSVQILAGPHDHPVVLTARPDDI